MPQADFYNRVTKQTESLLTDFFICGVCGGSEFDYKTNPEALAGRSDDKYIQVCQSCGNSLLVDRANYYVKNKSNYILLSEFKKEQKILKEKEKVKQENLARPKTPQGFKPVKLK